MNSTVSVQLDCNSGGLVFSPSSVVAEELDRASMRNCSAAPEGKGLSVVGATERSSQPRLVALRCETHADDMGRLHLLRVIIHYQASNINIKDAAGGLSTQFRLRTLYSRHHAYDCFYWMTCFEDNMLVLDTRRMEFSVAQLPLLEAIQDDPYNLVDRIMVEAGEGMPGMFVLLHGGSSLILYVCTLLALTPSSKILTQDIDCAKATDAC
jgi:hypothetical protein